MDILTILIIIFCHFICDFIMQDEQWANNKSINNKALLKHTATYSLLFGILGFFFILHNPIFWIYFTCITFTCHTITDYITSRIVKKKFQKLEYGSSIPNTGAFSVIGFDQVLHYFQLFLTYYYLIN